MILLLLFINSLNKTSIFETDNPYNFEVILKDLEDLRRNPIDLNSAGLKELLKIPYLTPGDALKIIDYRRRFHYFNAPADLYKIPGFDKELIELIQPFITVGKGSGEFKKFNTRFRIQDELPYSYSGCRFYTRTQVWTDQYHLFLVTEKDPDEENFFDYFSPGFVIDEGSRRFALGRYNLDFGNGIVLSPLGSFFNVYDFHLLINERGVMPYTSVMENNGFFGAAVSDSIFVRTTIFYSHQKLDGRIDSAGFARSFDPDGEHTDSLSFSRMDQIDEEIWGYDLCYKKSSFSLGNRFYRCYYNPPFASDDSLTGFYGRKFWMSSFNIKYTTGNFFLFGESARTFHNRWGGIFGFTSTFPLCDFNLAGKFFPRGFYSPKGSVVEEDYAGGVLAIKNISRIGRFEFIFGLDNELTSDTIQRVFRLNFEKRLAMMDAHLQYRWRCTEDIRDLYNYKIFLRIGPGSRVFFDIRFNGRYVLDDEEGWEKGLFFSLEGVYKTRRIDLRLRGGRYITDSYDSRVYVYEIDLPGVINNRPFYNRGYYGFIYVAVKPFSILKLTSKYSVQFKEDERIKKIGAQLDIEF